MAMDQSSMQINPLTFTRRELRAVSIAATMLIVLGTLAVVGMTVAFGHYNSLLHCGPKAAVDAMTIALLMQTQPRWRCLLMLGAVYAIVLLMQLGMPYVAGVIIASAAVSAGVGVLVTRLSRSMAIGAAAVSFVLATSFTFPIKILLSTAHADEPVLWALWLAEWPLRIAGAILGLVIARRLMRRTDMNHTMPQTIVHRISKQPSPATISVGIACAVMLVAASAPMLLDSWLTLSIATATSLLYGWIAGLRRALFTCLAAVVWGWAVFGAGSLLWHDDWQRVLDLGRTFALRFAPMTIAAVVLIQSARPRETVRLLRRLHVPRTVLLVLAIALRETQSARAAIYEKLHVLKKQSGKTLPIALMLRPVETARAVAGPLVYHFAGAMRRQSSEATAAGCHRNRIALADQD